MATEQFTAVVGTLALAFMCSCSTIAVLYVLQRSSLLSYPRAYLEAAAETSKKLQAVEHFLKCGYCLGTWLVLFQWLSLLMLTELQPIWVLGILGLLAGIGFFYALWGILLHCWQSN